MNKTYYKGSIFALASISSSTFSCNLSKYIKGKGNTSLKYLFSHSETEVDGKNIMTKLDVLKKVDITGMYPNLSSLYEPEEIHFSGEFCKKNIIYEKVLDESGAYYGKELYTGLIFPIADALDNKSVYTKKEKLEENANTIFYCVTYTINYEKMDKCRTVICDKQVADINEVNEYLEVKKHKRRFKREISKITKLANKNVYNSEIREAPKSEKKREKQDLMTIIMENIEFLLERLGIINSKLKEEYEKEYEQLISGDPISTSCGVNALSIASLASLEGKIEYAISCRGSPSSDIVQYLENLKKEYLNNFILNNQNKTNITLEEIDKLYEIFLKMKSSYNFKVQREVLKNIAFIYLMEVYENIGIISKEELEGSYFMDNKKTIIIAVESLIRMGLIDDIIIDYSSDLNVQELLDLISRIRFKKSTENKGTARLLENLIMSNYPG